MPECQDLQKICQRVREKSTSYERYNFSPHYNAFLKAFFDLAQEFDSLEDFYRICVAVPVVMTGFDGALYLDDDSQNRLFLVCDSKNGVYQTGQPAPEAIVSKRDPYESGNQYLVPVYSKKPKEPHQEETDSSSQQKSGWLLGMYSVFPAKDLTEDDRFFFRKYANRIGYNLHNRRIALQNVDHLDFIKTLVMDIEHNVIVPNMYFCHLFNRLKKNISELDALNEQARKAQETEKGSVNSADLTADYKGLTAELFACHQDLVKHHANISLFLESLFRREHFERGHLVLHPKNCFVEKEIILPQLEHYASRLKAADITVERPENMLDLEIQLRVDVGLLAQVYANLFSNAAKYTESIITGQGRSRKSMAYGREILDDYPEKGKKGVKFNVFTTGPNLSAEEGAEIFKEGVRGTAAGNISGTGHGLSFIRHVIELHGGTVGYEPTPEGNNFYFILPAPPVQSSGIQ